jgi:RNA-directed DNA polymerase
LNPSPIPHTPLKLEVIFCVQTVTSPLLSNLYLDPLDHGMAEADVERVRYADDFVILCRTEEEARQALERVQAWAATAGLFLHPTKTRIVDATQRGGFDFLGYHFERGQRWPRRKSLGKVREAIRARTRRTSGWSLLQAQPPLHLLGPGQVGSDAVAQSAPPPGSPTGRETGREHRQWPNAFFAEHGLFSLAAASALARQPSHR